VTQMPIACSVPVDRREGVSRGDTGEPIRANVELLDCPRPLGSGAACPTMAWRGRLSRRPSGNHLESVMVPFWSS
jgi:hypothetical protein